MSWKMKGTGIPITIGALGVVSKSLLRWLQQFEIERRAETTQTTALLKSATIPRRVLETCRDFLSLRLYWKTRLCWCKKLTTNNVIILIMSRCQHGSPSPFLTTRLYRPSLPGGLQGYILYRHRAVVYRLLLVVLLFLVHVKESAAYEFIHTSLACLVRLIWIIFVIGGSWP